MTVKKFICTVWDIIYPRRCAICDRTIRAGERVCRECSGTIKLIKGDTCMKCGKPLSDSSNVYCYDCRKSVRYFERGFAVFEYEYICSSLYRFKYTERPEYAEFYGLVTARAFGDTFKRLRVQAFIPVPIHKKRYQKRGYNQAEEYAVELSKNIGIPVRNDIISRTENTVPLKKLEALERQKTLKKAFKLLQNDVKLERVCVVDDIFTTGATINAIASLLKRAGVKEVYFVTVAIGKGL